MHEMLLFVYFLVVPDFRFSNILVCQFYLLFFFKYDPLIGEGSIRGIEISARSQTLSKLLIDYYYIFPLLLI